MKSPIKYFGGKNGMANKIIPYFPEGYTKLTYVEPFCGSAAMLFHKERSDVEIINDLDQNIYHLFKTLIDPEAFKEFKHLSDLSLYSEDIFNQYLKDLKTDITDVERAYKFFYCNRVAYNGIGGFSSSNVVRRKMSKSVSDFLSAVDGLFDIHNRLSNVVVHQRDALELIKKWDKEGVFMYLDSPYALETRSSGGYKHDMTDEQQDEYLRTLLSIENAKVLVSGYNCDRYNVLDRAGWKRVDIEIKTQNNNRVGKVKVESLWFNY